MEFLDKLVSPQSLEHLKLLHYLSGMVLILFVPFLGMLIGGLWLSLYYKSKSAKTSNTAYLKFAGEIIEHTTITKSAGVAFGIVPVITLLMTYAQILHTVENTIFVYFFLGLFFIIPGTVLAYVFRYSFSFSTLYSELKENISQSKNTDALKRYDTLAEKTLRLKQRSGRWALIFLLVGTFFFSAGVTLLTTPQAWGASTGLIAVFSNVYIWMRWLMIVILSFVISGGYLLFIYFFWEGGVKFIDSSYQDIVKKNLPKVTLLSGLVLPLFILVNASRFPAQAYSNSLFFFFFVSIIVLFISYHFLYDMLRNNHTKRAMWVFFLALSTSSSIVIAEEAALSGYSHKHALILGLNYDKSYAELQKAVGTAGGVDVAGIFNTKCLACHSFDKKVVGPPYKETLPKYEGKTAQLAEFIKNPVKKNPDYPIMPNQGLKPQEAAAIAKFILEEYKKR